MILLKQLVLAEIYCTLVFILLVGIPLFFTVQTFIFHHLFGHQDILVGLLRLRKCGRNTTCPALMGKCSIIRELHVYGTAVPVHGRDADKLQHQVIYSKACSLIITNLNKTFS
jgi:hypothetical protein